MAYNFKKIEKKWQQVWDKTKIYEAQDKSKKPKWYSLIEFPYPSGAGLHVGHIRSQTAMDIISRKRRMEGYNVLYPIGWDAFGLPTENYAIKTGIPPAKVTKQNTDIFRRQLKSLGLSFDWSREVDTTDPNYYKWTQWIFLQLFKRGLAYKTSMPINWCPKDKIGLANEEVVDGKCERCGTVVEKREKEQWMLKITAYAEKLLDGLKQTDFLDVIKTQQTNWIGKSIGAEIDFSIKGSKERVRVFTTRPDTLFGATYLVLAPEHPIIQNLKLEIKNLEEVEKYALLAKKKTEMERSAEGKEKTGIKLEGVLAINPATNGEIPVFIADYVLGGYGTGAIMAVPAHDLRDMEFAKGNQQFNLMIKEVVKDGNLVNSGKFNGMKAEEAMEAITKFVGGSVTTKYKLRDWVFSRQRYWGEPIPIIHCVDCGYVAVPEKDLPVKLPNVKRYEPTDTGESPLSAISSWVKVKCPKCKKPAKRETDVMPNWAGSSWYFLRYTDPKNKKKFADAKKLKYFMPVDWYNGGMEHVTLHLLYSRFWNQFLFDEGHVPVSEPYKKRTAHGLILGEGGIKMSKSKGNVINPDDVTKIYGADALRMYEMFMGPFDQAIAWDTKSIEGVSRFLGRIWNFHTTSLKLRSAVNQDLEVLINKTIKKVSEDIEAMGFNTAISALMIFFNECQRQTQIPKSVWENFLLLLAPFAPHITEELWADLGHKKTIHLEPWPKYNAKLTQDADYELVVQINGKFRAKIKVSAGISEEEAKEIALKNPLVLNHVQGKNITKAIFVPGRLINFVVS